MMYDKKKLFISSVQAEFQEERRALVAYIRQDPMLSRYFEPYIFEESPAQDCSAQRAYMDEVEASDIYLGLYGERYGFEDKEGISPTEREYDAATQRNLYRIVLIKDVPARQTKEQQLIYKYIRRNRMWCAICSAPMRDCKNASIRHLSDIWYIKGYWQEDRLIQHSIRTQQLTISINKKLLLLLVWHVINVNSLLPIARRIFREFLMRLYILYRMTDALRMQLYCFLQKTRRNGLCPRWSNVRSSMARNPLNRFPLSKYIAEACLN